MHIGFPLVPMYPFSQSEIDAHIGLGILGCFCIPLGLFFIIATMATPNYPKKDREDLQMGFLLLGLGILSPILGAYVVGPVLIATCLYVLVITPVVVYNGFRQAFSKRRN